MQGRFSAEIGLWGLIHGSLFVPDGKGNAIETRDNLDLLLSALSKKIESGGLKSVGVEFAPDYLKEWRALMPLLKAQKDPTRISIPLDGRKLMETPFWPVIERIAVGECRGNLNHAMRRFTIAVYSARLINFLDAKGVKIIALGNKAMTVRSRRISNLVEDGVLPKEANYQGALEQDEMVETKIAALKRKKRLPQVLLAGANHLVELGERLEHHGIKCDSRLLYPENLPTGLLDWKSYLIARDHILRQRKQEKTKPRTTPKKPQAHRV
ncbi:MAG: hypothetical protein V1493_05765 [Candidatus Diapherotrites archaeon]